MLDVNAIRSQFPILGEKVHGKSLVYLDNAATTQKPLSVINRIDAFYKETNANIHRGAHHLANISTEYFENTRELTRAFLNAREIAEIIFTSGTTDSINLVAQTWGRQNISKGDEILLSMLEHHSNIVPWQMLAEEKGAVIKVIPIHDNGTWQVEKRSLQKPTQQERKCSSTELNPSRICPSMCKHSIVISIASAHTNCMDQQALACYTANANCLRPCHLGAEEVK